MSSLSAVRRSLHANWFFLILPVLLAISFFFTRSVDWRSEGQVAEAVTVFDWMVTVPLLYFLCYRKQLSRRQMALRLLGIAGLGIWIAVRLVPAQEQAILGYIGWARYAGGGFLIVLELAVLAAVLKIAFSKDAKTEQLQEQGVPPLLAKLMLLEARFWRAVWRLIRGR